MRHDGRPPNPRGDDLALTYATVGLSLAIAGAVGTAVVRSVSPAPFIGAFGFSEAAMLGYAIAGLSWASVGSILVVRRPGNAIGWLMVVVGVGYALSQLTVAVTFSLAADGTADGDRLSELTGWVTVALQLVTILPFAIGFLFPTGRPQSPRLGQVRAALLGVRHHVPYGAQPDANRVRCN